MEISDLLVSVVIPVKNGDAWLDETIPAILEQKINGKLEIIAIDSGSTDNTLSILNKYNVRIIQIPPSEFNHGRTRNLGVKEANGKYVVMTVQDAKPINDLWLQNLLEGFFAENVAGVCGQQIVPHLLTNNPIQWYRPVSKPKIKDYFFEHSAQFASLPPDEQLNCCRWDDVNAMYRRNILLQLPFREVNFAEDALWAKEALLNGYRIVYNTKAQVEHYHLEVTDFTFKRNFTVKFHQYLFFKALPKSNENIFLVMLRFAMLLLGEKRIPLSDKIKWLKYNYEIQIQLRRSNKLFLEKEKNGIEELTKTHEIICGVIPQAVKPKSKL